MNSNSMIGKCLLLSSFCNNLSLELHPTYDFDRIHVIPLLIFRKLFNLSSYLSFDLKYPDISNCFSVLLSTLDINVLLWTFNT